jgi:multiple sugar transport system substrate-binding protein
VAERSHSSLSSLSSQGLTRRSLFRGASVLAAGTVAGGLATSLLSGSAVAAPVRAAAGILHLTFWNLFGEAIPSNPYSMVMQSVVDDWNHKNPKVQVKMTYVPESGTGQSSKLLTAVAAGTPPDIANVDRFAVPSWAAQGALTDLTEYGKTANLNPRNYAPYTWDEAHYNGRLYALPGGPDAVDIRVLFVRNDILKQHHLNPDYLKTTDDLHAAALTLTKKKGSSFETIGFVPWYGNWFIYGWGWAFGGHFHTGTGPTFKLTLTNPKVVEALAWMASWTKEFPVATVNAATSAYGNNTHDPLITGQMPMIINGNWMLTTYAQYAPHLDYSVIPVPTPPGLPATSWSGGFGYAVPKGAANVEASWNFIQFFCNEQNSLTMAAATTTFPAWLDALHSPVITRIPHIQTFLDLVPVAHGRPVTPAAQLLWNELTTDATNNALYHKMSAEEALLQAQQAVNAYLATLKK